MFEVASIVALPLSQLGAVVTLAVPIVSLLLCKFSVYCGISLKLLNSFHPYLDRYEAVLPQGMFTGIVRVTPENTPQPYIIVGAVGLRQLISINPLHDSNAAHSIIVTEFPIVTEVRPLQLWNAPSLIEVTEFGMVTEVRPLQP